MAQKWAKLKRMRGNRQKRPIINSIKSSMSDSNLPREKRWIRFICRSSHEVALLIERKRRSL